MTDTASIGEAKQRLSSLDVERLGCLEKLLSLYKGLTNYVLLADLYSRLGDPEAARETGKVKSLLLIKTNSGICASAFTEATLRDLPSLSRIIPQILKHELIMGRQIPVKRAFSPYISSSGHILAQQVREIFNNQSDAFFAGVSKQDRYGLLRIARNIYHKAGRDGAK